MGFLNEHTDVINKPKINKEEAKSNIDTAAQDLLIRNEMGFYGDYYKGLLICRDRGYTRQAIIRKYKALGFDAIQRSDFVEDMGCVKFRGEWKAIDINSFNGYIPASVLDKVVLADKDSDIKYLWIINSTNEKASYCLLVAEFFDEYDYIPYRKENDPTFGGRYEEMKSRDTVLIKLTKWNPR